MTHKMKTALLFFFISLILLGLDGRQYYIDNSVTLEFRGLSKIFTGNGALFIILSEIILVFVGLYFVVKQYKAARINRSKSN